MINKFVGTEVLTKKMRKFISEKSIAELKSDFARLLDQHKKKMLDVVGVKLVLSEYVLGYTGKRYTLNPEEIVLYRARINKDKEGSPVDFFTHTDQLGAPPKKDARKGRCNNAEESILYCSDHPITCLAELRGMKENDFITIIIYEIRKDRKLEPVSFVGVDILKENDSPLQNLIKDFYGDLKIDSDFEKIKLIDDLMANEFRLEMDEEGNHHIYNATIAWRQLCFEYSKSNCLIYPSASSLLKTANYALDTIFANEILVPTEAHRYKIMEIRNGVDFTIARDNEAALNGFGDINWKTIQPPIIEYITHRRLTGDPFKMKPRLVGS